LAAASPVPVRGDEHLRQYRRCDHGGSNRFIVHAYGWNPAFYVVSGLCLLGALLFTQIDGKATARPGVKLIFSAYVLFFDYRPCLAHRACGARWR
jgi:hypothetical protein